MVQMVLDKFPRPASPGVDQTGIEGESYRESRDMNTHSGGEQQEIGVLAEQVLYFCVYVMILVRAEPPTCELRLSTL